MDTMDDNAAAMPPMPGAHLTEVTGDGTGHALPPIETGEAQPEREAPSPVLVDGVSIAVPVVAGVERDTHCRRHVDLRLTQEEARVLKRLTLGLGVQNERVRSRHGEDRPVANQQDAVRWLLQQIGGVAE